MPLTDAAFAALASIVALAFAVEACVGFGATIITVALGSLLVPIERLLPVFIPLNVALSAWLSLRYWRDVDVRLLARRMLPLMALGLPLGLFAHRRANGAALTRGFGVFVLVLALLELRQALAPARPHTEPARWVRALALFAGGVVHGAFGTGGPLAVWVAGHELRRPAAFRSTLSALWLTLNIALVCAYAAAGSIDRASLGATARLGAALVIGLAVGEWAHRRVPERAFRPVVFGGLALVGAVLVVRG